MTDKVTKNVPESVRQRLLAIAKKQNAEFTNILIRYAIERLLYRVSISPYSDRLLLKGAMLLALWTKQPYRPTLDVDFLAGGNYTMDSLLQQFREILQIECAEDGLIFLPDTLQIDRIKEGQQYEGFRITCRCRLAQAVLPVQVDIAFGDAVTPSPLEMEYPTLLDLPAPVLLTYPRETVVAEKFEAMVKLGMANSRMKDFSDVYYLASNFEFNGPQLTAAVTATFKRRKTNLPSGVPMALTSEFFDNRDKRNQWRGFSKKANLGGATPELPEICQKLSAFLMPVSAAATAGDRFRSNWSPARGWSAE